MKILSTGSVVGYGRAAYAAVGVSYLRQGHLKAILIEQRSCGLVSPCGRARRYLIEAAFGNEGCGPLETEAVAWGRVSSAPTQPRRRRIKSRVPERTTSQKAKSLPP